MQRGNKGRTRSPMTLRDAHLASAQRMHYTPGMAKLTIGDRVRYVREIDPTLEETAFNRPRYGQVEGFYTDNLVQVSWDDGLGPNTTPRNNLGPVCRCGALIKETLCACGAE